MHEMIIRDPLYNYISIKRDSIIKNLIDTPEFQRLRYIKQLGVTFLTFPSATHTRFCHSLGAYHLSKRLCEFLKIEQSNSDNAELIKIAAILHDIGHMGLSHLFEKIFTNKKHEFWTKKIIESRETEINQILSKNYDPKKISRRLIQGPSDPSFFHNIISSQLDVDRFDYLLRDSYFTGNPCGMFDIERLLRVLSPENGLLCVNENKGRYVIEQYIISRYLMYNMVYSHRVTIGIEEMLKMIFNRAIDIEEIQGIPTNSPIYLLLNNEELKLEDYLKIKDDTIFSTIMIWKDSKDPVLRDLCKNFFSRDILKALRNQISITTFEEYKDKIEKILQYHEIEPKYNLIFVKSDEKDAYSPYDVTSEEEEREDAIFFNNMTEIVKKIPTLKVLKIVKNSFLYLPIKVHEEVNRSISKIGG